MSASGVLRSPAYRNENALHRRGTYCISCRKPFAVMQVSTSAQSHSRLQSLMASRTDCTTSPSVARIQTGRSKPPLLPCKQQPESSIVARRTEVRAMSGDRRCRNHPASASDPLSRTRAMESPRPRIRSPVGRHIDDLARTPVNDRSSPVQTPVPAPTARPVSFHPAASPRARTCRPHPCR